MTKEIMSLFKSKQSALKRGLLIVVEGLDRAGKSSQCQRLVDDFNSGSDSTVAKLWRFPMRDSLLTGPILDKILSGSTKVDTRALHLIFSANRWECMSEIKQLLQSGTHVIVDRYAFSGLVYSSIQGVPFDWCMGADKGLIRPDLVLLLDLPVSVSASRGGFGLERYEKREFQEKVRLKFNELTRLFQGADSKIRWRVIDASKDFDSVYSEMTTELESLLNSAAAVDPLIYEDLYI